MGRLPTGRPDLSRLWIAGAVLALVGTAFFIALYITLAEAEPVARVLISMCVPPAVIAGLIGVYILVVRPSSD